MFPNDEDGQVLQMLWKEGVNFKEPQNLDFYIVCPNEQSLINSLQQLEENDFIAEGFFYEEDDEWSCMVYVNTMLNHATIVEIQAVLDELVNPFDAHSDGWGMMVE